MNQQPPGSPSIDQLVPPPKMNTRRIFKIFLYVIGALIAEFGILGGTLTAVETNKDLTNRAGGAALIIGIIALAVSIYIFVWKRFYIHSLRWSRYFLWILGVTVVSILLLCLEFVFVPNPNDKITPSVIFAFICLIYGIGLMGIAYLQPPLRQRIDESTRRILETVPGQQIALSELLTRLQNKYSCSNTLLQQYIDELKYIDQLDILGTNTKVVRMKGANEVKTTMAFPQVATIANPTLRANIERAPPDLTEDKVDIGLFMLGREFETTLKWFLTRAYAKGKLTSTPGNKRPDELKLVEMISCLKTNGIVTDDAALSYLRQSRNDRAHGVTPTLTERRLLMNNVRHLANLYIDYIKWFDDLTRTL